VVGEKKKLEVYVCFIFGRALPAENYMVEPITETSGSSQPFSGDSSLNTDGSELKTALLAFGGVAQIDRVPIARVFVLDL
jgi:hypothetical protein